MTLILINFKTYRRAIGRKALILAQNIAQVRSRMYEIAVAPSFFDLKEICQKVNLPVFAQHVDDDSYGANTGHVLPVQVKEAGCVGTILNHSEKKLPLKRLRETIKQCKRNQLQIVVCASSLHEVKLVARLKPDYLAYEPWTLIGGNVSVTAAKPKMIIEAVQLVKKISPKTKLLVGAGVHSNQDLQQALLLGAEGILIGHAVSNAKNPKQFLAGMLGKN